MGSDDKAEYPRAVSAGGIAEAIIKESEADHFLEDEEELSTWEETLKEVDEEVDEGFTDEQETEAVSDELSVCSEIYVGKFLLVLISMKF